MWLGFDPLYWAFMLPAFLLTILAQMWVRSAYGRYRRVRNGRGLTGLQAAEILLQAEGLDHVGLEMVPGALTDHYDPRTKVLRLSAEVARTPSVAALGIVAHECGHALQDARGSLLLRARGALVPAANLGSQLAPYLILLGALFDATGLIQMGLLLFSAAVAFTLITLPVEIDASRRALAMLRRNGLVTDQELGGARAVLIAAAMTYVAAAATALLQFLYFWIRFAGRRRD